MPPVRRGRPDWPTAAPFIPAGADLPALRSAAAGCRGCPLHEPATQTVFGQGVPHARMVLVGEQPGDQEDLAGAPFVGPAGRLLDTVLEQAGIDRSTTYVTNTVKHFKFTLAGSGKRRIHATPDTYEVAACKPWLLSELELVQPELVVLLGATAAKALFGPAFRVTQSRGILMPWPPAEGPSPPGRSAPDLPAPDLFTPDLFTPDLFAPENAEDRSARDTAPGTLALATIHPSAVLRADDKEAAQAGLVADLAVAAKALAS